MKSIELKVKRTYYNNGQISNEIYEINNAAHNPDGPALRQWYSNGTVCECVYYIHDTLHREDGPAYQHWDAFGDLTKEIYAINGIEMTKEEFEKKTQPCDGKVVEIDGKKYKLTEVN